MLAFIGNLSFLEMGMILVIAVLVFGRRLPEVAGQAAAQLHKARRALTDLRRESGIDEELRKARRTLTSADMSMRRQSAPKPSWYPKTDPGGTPHGPKTGGDADGADATESEEAPPADVDRDAADPS
jgi:Sec-independent protein translocase protein TatA